MNGKECQRRIRYSIRVGDVAGKLESASLDPDRTGRLAWMLQMCRLVDVSEQK